MPHGHRFRHLFMHGDGSMTGWFGDPEHYERFASRFERRLRTRIAAEVGRVAAAGRRPRARRRHRSRPAAGGDRPAQPAGLGDRAGRLAPDDRGRQGGDRARPAGDRRGRRRGEAAVPGRQRRPGRLDAQPAPLAGPARPRSRSWPGCSRRAAGSGSTTCAGRCGPRRPRRPVAFPGRTCGSSGCGPASSAGCSPASPSPAAVTTAPPASVAGTPGRIGCSAYRGRMSSQPGMVDWDLAVSTATRLISPGPEVSRSEADAAVRVAASSRSRSPPRTWSGSPACIPWARSR